MRIRNFCLPVFIMFLSGLVACGDMIGNDYDNNGVDDVSEPESDVLVVLDVFIEDESHSDFSGSDSWTDTGKDTVVGPDVTADSEPSDTGSGETVSDIQQTGLYITKPSILSCKTGKLTNDQKDRVRKRVNDIRSLHGLEPVDYNGDGDTVTAECSLMCVSNRKLSHEPPRDWLCWSQEGYDGCHSSNIFLQWGVEPVSYPSVDIVDGFMTDEGVDTLGHRRWLIDPWLKYISFGRVDDYINESPATGAAIKVINDEMADISGTEITMVAYPYEDYPASLYNDNVRMSFSVVDSVASKWAKGNKNVDFSNVTITITDRQGNPVNINEESILYDNAGYGIPNNLRWFADSISNNARYDVTISDVDVNGITKEFKYYFRLM